VAGYPASVCVCYIKCSKRGKRGKKKRKASSKNRVWVRPQTTTAGVTAETEAETVAASADTYRYYPETDVVFISPESLAPARPVGQGGKMDAVDGDGPRKPDKPAELVTLQGHERKTKQGNRQWVKAGHRTVIQNKLAAAIPDGPAVPGGPDEPPVNPAEGQGRDAGSPHLPDESPEKPVNQESGGLQDPRTKPATSAAQRLPETVRLLGHEKKTRQGNKQWVTSGVHKPAKPGEPAQLIGHEKKTRQGNKQWVVANKPVHLGSPVKPVGLVGREKKTKHGNKQWVMAGHTPRRRLSQGSSRTRHRPGLVSFNGGRYTMDRTGKKLKRLSGSSFSGVKYVVDRSGRKLKRLSGSSLGGGRYAIDHTGKRLKRLSNSSLGGGRYGYTVDHTGKKLRRISSSSLGGGRYSIDRTGKRLKRLSASPFGGGKYAIDHSGKRLKRLSSSSSQLACLSPAISGYLEAMASGSVKRIKARYTRLYIACTAMSCV
jgi:hypothetical protein